MTTSVNKMQQFIIRNEMMLTFFLEENKFSIKEYHRFLKGFIHEVSFNLGKREYEKLTYKDFKGVKGIKKENFKDVLLLSIISHFICIICYMEKHYHKTYINSLLKVKKIEKKEY